MWHSIVPEKVLYACFLLSIVSMHSDQARGWITENCGSIPERSKIFNCFSNHPLQIWGLGVHKADHSPPSVARVESEESYTSSLTFLVSLSYFHCCNHCYINCILWQNKCFSLVVLQFLLCVRVIIATRPVAREVQVTVVHPLQISMVPS
jgi:hypothetical protein